MKIESEKKNFIELFGHFGEFSVPGSNLKIKYFSTFANKRESNTGPSLLLEELKPMRERADSSEIEDINSLLQRDLNDSRVATELIPYLLGKKRNNIAFFPAILAALVPNGFLTSENSTYPSITKEQDTGDYLISEYGGGKWKLQIFKDEDSNKSPLGKLFIDKYTTEIIVLDGQHRANAFRVICDSFEDREDSIYEAFYEDIEPNTSYNSDLPVTLIWFESPDEKLDPKLISRKLFVDVNSNARPVNESRKILLNDFEPAAVLTKYFYSTIASEESFNFNKFSLLHSGFDVDSDLKKSTSHVFTLTTPQIMYEVNNWLFFGTRINNRLNRYRVKQTPSSFTDLSQCDRIVPKFKSSTTSFQDDNGNYRKHFYREEDEEIYLDEYKNRIYPIFKKIFDEFIFIKKHFDACEVIEGKFNNEWSGEKKEIWKKVFSGGEGLYYSFKNIPSKKVENSNRIQFKLQLIDEIENEFREIRSEYFEDVESRRIDLAYKSVKTKAFQIGFFMAFLDYLYEQVEEVNSENIQETLNNFLKDLNDITPIGWINIFTDLRSDIMRSGTNPRSWPAYHKIILRITQKEGQFFLKDDESRQKTPEVQVFKNKLDQKFGGWLNSSGTDKEEVDFSSIKDILSDWIDSSIQETKALFKATEIGMIDGIEWQVIGTDYMKNKVEDED